MACGASAQRDGVAFEQDEEATLRVLVVEDDPVTQRHITRFLEGTGCGIAVASNGREGLRLALEQRPHLVVTDWIMPGMDGPELCRALRTGPRGALLYIIMLTMHEEEARLIEAFEAGANDYLVKPFNRRVLAARFGAGRRIVELHRELERERDEVRHYMTELAEVNRRLAESAMTDSLTGLPNRRYAMEQLDKEWARASRSNLPLACLLVDMDKFKQINDGWGHDIGDLALQSVANALRGAARKTDLVCRLGGDEFIVVCADADAAAAMTVAERLRLATETNEINEIAHTQVRTTITIGAAVRNTSMHTPAELLRAADQALLSAKRAQRNSVLLATA